MQLGDRRKQKLTLEQLKRNDPKDIIVWKVDESLGEFPWN